MVSRVLQCLLFRATVCSLLSCTCTRSYGRVAVHMCVVPLPRGLRGESGECVRAVRSCDMALRLSGVAAATTAVASGVL